VGMYRSGILGAGIFLFAVFANATSRNTMMQITVIDSETRAGTLDNNGVPRNCDQVTFDAYCRSTSTVPLVNTLLVQEGNEPPFRISCTMDSRYSRCRPLPKGASFDARREKKGITVYFVDDKGKARKQLYSLVDAGGKVGLPAAMATNPAPAAVENTAVPSPTPQSTVIDSTARGSQTSMVPSAKNSSGAPGPGWVPVVDDQKVRCNFSSTPPGAEITVDGQYLGNTPSAVSLSIGTHVVVFAMPGFVQWTRELTVSSDSALNVSPVLQKVR
jgi:hypothetical protein